MDEKHIYFSVTLDNRRGFRNIHTIASPNSDVPDSEDRILELKELFATAKISKQSLENIQKGVSTSKNLLSYLLAALKQDEHVLSAVIRRIDFWMKITVSFSLICVMRQVHLIKSVFHDRLSSRRQSRA